jgi:hypothetical protein
MIDSLEEKNGIGGIQPFKIARSKDILIMPYLKLGNILAEAVTLNSTAAWININPKYQSIDYIENSERNDSGECFAVKLSCFVARADYERSIAILNLDNDHFILDVVDNIGYRRLVGTKHTPLLFNAGLTIPKTIQDISGFEISFTGKILVRAPHYNI